MLFVSLSDDQRTELEQISRQAVGRVALRAQMVLLSDRDASVSEIARIHGCGQEVVRLWLHRYRAVRRHLKGAGWRWRRPRLAPASLLRQPHDPERPVKEAAIADALRAASRGRQRVLFLDECDLQLLPVVRACWQRGRRWRVPTPGINAKRALFGALDATSGVFHTMDQERKLAVHFVAFLTAVVACYPAEDLVLVMDNVATHHAKVVRQWLDVHPQVTILWLPRYAAHEVNPAERIWGLLKTHVAANRLAGSIEALTDEARRCFAELDPHSVSASFLDPAA